MIYDPNQLLQNIDNNLYLFLGMAMASLTANYVFFGAAIVNARRDQVAAFPLLASSIWFAHDLSFLLMFDEWFNQYNHWYLKLFWLGLIPTTIFELLFIRDFLRYGKPEVAPDDSNQFFHLYCLGVFVIGAVAWVGTKHFLDDPIYAWSFASTGFLAPACGLFRYMKRRDAGGQSIVLWVSYCLMQSIWYTMSWIVFGGAFRSIAYVALGVACIVGGLLMIFAVHNSKKGLAQQPGMPPKDMTANVA